MKSASCPCCLQTVTSASFSPNLRPSGKAITFPIFQCPQCQHAWLSTDTVEHELIEAEYAHDYEGHRTDKFFESRVRESLTNEILPIVPPPADILDVGCGNGAFILVANSMGYNAVGIDISPGGVSIARSRGANAIEGDFLTYEFDRKFDIITMWDVVEHLRDPAVFFERARVFLKPGGLLVIKTPGISQRSFRIIRGMPWLAGFLLHAPHHVQYWTPSSMTALLTRTRFPELIWWQSSAFRSPPKAKTLRKILGRGVKTLLRKYAANKNLYLAARF